MPYIIDSFWGEKMQNYILIFQLLLSINLYAFDTHKAIDQSVELQAKNILVGYWIEGAGENENIIKYNVVDIKGANIVWTASFENLNISCFIKKYNDVIIDHLLV